LLPILTKLPPLFDTETEKVARMYSNLGSILRVLGQNNQALSYHLKAIAIRKKVLGEKHPDLAASYNNIANTYERLGDYDQSLAYHLNLRSALKCARNNI
jgi:tetratricopeptide (TPR) repeat protein